MANEKSVVKRVMKYFRKTVLGSNLEDISEEITDEQKAIWERSQEFEFNFWVNQWTTTHAQRDGQQLSIEEIISARQKAGIWLLQNFHIPISDDLTSEIFAGTVLEVGCGPIGFFEQFSAVKVLGIDPLMGQFAAHLYYSVLGARNNYLYDETHIKDLRDNEFDWIVCSNVLDHTENYKFMLREMMRVADKRGVILLVTDCRNKGELGHAQAFSAGQILDYVVRHGFFVEFCKIVHPLHAGEDAVSLFAKIRQRN